MEQDGAHSLLTGSGPPPRNTDHDADAAMRGLLAIMAYNRLLAHQYEEAEALYAFLERLDPADDRWAIGRSVCLVWLGAAGDAGAHLTVLDGHPIPAQEQAVLARLKRRIAWREKQTAS